MLSPADAELVARDEGIPGLAILLDPSLFTTELRKGGYEVKSTELRYLRYKPSTNCVAAYRVCADGKTIDLYAKAHGPDASVKMSKADLRFPSHPADDCFRSMLASHRIAVFSFPRDAKLTVLSRLDDPERRPSLLTRILPNHGIRGDEPVDPLSYKPERRFVGRIQPHRGAAAVLRFYTPEGFAPAVRGSRSFESRDILRVAQKCGGSKRHHAVALPWLSGQPLREALADRSLRGAHIDSVGRALAELHAQSSAKLQPRHWEPEARRLHELASTLSFLCPAEADRSSRIAHRIASQRAEDGNLRSIHGDFYDKQVLVEGDRIAILDFDQAAIGDPRVDLGQFLAHLERDCLFGSYSRPEFDEAREGFLEGYQRESGARVDGLDWYVGDALFRLAHHPFRSHEPEWPTRTTRILSRVEEILSHEN